MEGLGCLPPPPLWLSALRVPSGASHQRMSPPKAYKRLHVSLVYVGLGTGDAPLLASIPKGGCGCGGIGIWCCWLLCLAFQYSIPECGQHPMQPLGHLPGFLEDLITQAHPSLGSEDMEFSLVAGPQNGHACCPFGPLPACCSTSSPLQVAPEVGQNDSGGPFHLFGPAGQWAGQSFEHIYLMWKRLLIFSQEIQYPTSWTAGTSAPGSSLRRPCWQPQQISLSAFFHP